MVEDWSQTPSRFLTLAQHSAPTIQGAHNELCPARNKLRVSLVVAWRLDGESACPNPCMYRKSPGVLDSTPATLGKVTCLPSEHLEGDDWCCRKATLWA